MLKTLKGSLLNVYTITLFFTAFTIMNDRLAQRIVVVNAGFTYFENITFSLLNNLVSMKESNPAKTTLVIIVMITCDSSY